MSIGLHLVTEDYSEYESVDEEETQVEEAVGEATPMKGKKSNKAKDESKIKSEKEDAAASAPSSQKETSEPRKVIKPAPPKRTRSMGGSKVTHKGSLMNFFGKK